MYSGKDVPAVGVSIGVERVFTVLEARLRAEAEAASRKLRATRTQVLVGAFGKGLQVRHHRRCYAPPPEPVRGCRAAFYAAVLCTRWRYPTWCIDLA